MDINTLIADLIDATYDTGWYSSRIETGRTEYRKLHEEALARRNDVKKQLLMAIAELGKEKSTPADQGG